VVELKRGRCKKRKTNNTKSWYKIALVGEHAELKDILRPLQNTYHDYYSDSVFKYLKSLDFELLQRPPFVSYVVKKKLSIPFAEMF